jgi:hypothetical protein
VVVGLALLIGFNLLNQPPAVHPDGGFPAAETAAARILAATGADTTITFARIPYFKSTEAYAYPLIRAGASVLADTEADLSPARAGPWSSSAIRCSRSRSVRHAVARPEATVAPPDRFGEPVEPLRGGAWSDDLGLSGRPGLHAVTARGIANAGAPDAGVRCPRPGPWRANPGRALVCAQ